MSAWEATGKTDEWMTPAYIMDAIGEEFDLDVAAPPSGPLHVQAGYWFSESSIEKDWKGFVWMNPPYGGRNALMPWVWKFLIHGNGLALLPDRTSAPWFAPLAEHADALMFFRNKIKFERTDGTVGKSPGNGSVLVACGRRAELALLRATPRLGYAVKPIRKVEDSQQE